MDDKITMPYVNVFEIELHVKIRQSSEKLSVKFYYDKKSAHYTYIDYESGSLVLEYDAPSL